MKKKVFIGPIQEALDNIARNRREKQLSPNIINGIASGNIKKGSLVHMTQTGFIKNVKIPKIMIGKNNKKLLAKNAYLMNVNPIDGKKEPITELTFQTYAKNGKAKIINELINYSYPCDLYIEMKRRK